MQSSIVSKTTTPEDLTTAGPELVVKRLLLEIQRTEQAFPEAPEADPEGVVAWKDRMEKHVLFAKAAEQGFGTAGAVGLALMRKHWDDLPHEFREIYGNNFYGWAIARTGKAIGTIDNHIRAAETFILKGAGPDKPLIIPVRDLHNRPVIEEGSSLVKTKSVVFDPLSVDISKLVLARGRAENGSMSEADWQALADPGCSWEQFQMQLHGSSGGGGGGRVGMQFRLAGPILVAQEDDVTVELGELVWDRYYDDEDSLEHRAINRLMLALGINLDEVIIQQQAMKKENERLYGSQNKQGNEAEGFS